MSKEIRSRLIDELKTDADFNAFCIDEFPDIYRRFSATADRQQRINDLFQLAGAEEVSHKLSAWLARPMAPPPPPMQRNVAWIALGAAALAIFTLCMQLVAALLRPQIPQVIYVPIGEFNRQTAAQGIMRDHLDSPEQFAIKVQSAGPRNVRYEVSIDRDQKTQELERLVLALRVQNDQLVAATKYLLGQVQHWQGNTTPQAKLLAQLTKEFEEKIQMQPLADMATPILLDLTIPQRDIQPPEPEYLAPPNMPNKKSSTKRTSKVEETPYACGSAKASEEACSGAAKVRGGTAELHSGTAEVRGGTIEVRGSLDKELIRRVIIHHHKEVKFCYDTGLQLNSNLQGRVMIAFTIGRTGQVAAGFVQSSTMNDRSVEQCIAQKVCNWVFPQPQGGCVVVTYPFVLKTSED